MIKKIVIICALLFLLPPAYVLGDSVFSDETFEMYEDAVYLNNNERDYLNAYRQILKAERRMNEELSANSVTPVKLNGEEFHKPYWLVLKSKAEIAYKLGLHTVMEDVACKLNEAKVIRQWNEKDIHFTKDIAGSDIEKIRGSRFLLIQKYDSAAICLSEALRLRGELLEYDDFLPFCVPVSDDLASAYYNQGKYEEALQVTENLLANPKMGESRRSSSKVYSYTRNRLISQKALILARCKRYSEAIKLIDSVLGFYKSENSQREYAETFRKKAKILMLRYDDTGEYDSKTLDCYREYLSITRKYIDKNFIGMNESEREQYWMAEQPFATDCYRLENKDPSLLYDVALFSKAVLLQMGRDFKPDMTAEQKRDALAAIRVRWTDVQAKMPDNSAAIEFICYERGGENCIAALVLKKGVAAPSFVPIAAVDSILQMGLENGETVEQAVEARDYNGRHKDFLYNDYRLAGLIWNEKLVNAIGDSESVYFSADGLFHVLAVEYLLPEPLKEKQFYRLTSTRLLTAQTEPLSTASMFLCGGVNFNAKCPSEPSTDNDAVAYYNLADRGLSNFSDLPTSLDEVDSVMAIRANPADTVIVGDSATEYNVRSHLSDFDLILISTHGTFLSDGNRGTDVRPATTDDGLSKSCIILAGANENIDNNGFDPLNLDGVLSAREIAGMDLSNVQLVVLSACQTAQGVITGDGVYGLQRGLKTAGVRAMIVSLWEVRSKETMLLMCKFFEFLNEGQQLYSAFNNARNWLRNVMGSRIRNHPRYQVYNDAGYYDAFILIDGIEP